MDSVSGMADRIQFVMLERNIFQADLCRLSGLSSALISQVVNGETENPRISTLAAIAEALGVSLDYLVFGHDGSCDCVDTMQSRLNDNYLSLDYRYRFRLFEESEILSRLQSFNASSSPSV